MKSALFVLLTFFAVTANANVGGAKTIYRCETNTDPDTMTIDVVSANGKTYAALSQQSCDGDCGAEDLVEIKIFDNGNDAVRTYVQVAGAKASYPGMKVEKPSRKTRGLVLNIKVTGGNGIAKGVSDPLGMKFPKTELECTAIVSAK